jgi:hypothetical protein
MHGKILGSLLLAGLALIVILVSMEMRRTNFAEDACYAMDAPAEPTVCK